MSDSSSEYPPELAVGVTSSRIMLVSAAARGVHRAILRGFAAAGFAPSLDSLIAGVPEAPISRHS